MGSSDDDWIKVRKAWVANNPPSHEGHYVCGICGKTVHISEMGLDHITPRSGAPASKYDFANLQPSHGSCNYMKGSKRLKPLISKAEYDFRRELDL